MAFSLAACGSTNANGTSGTQTSETQNTSEDNTTVTETEKQSADNSTASEETAGTAATGEDSASDDTSAEDAAGHSDILVAYFSATGTTKGVAERIAAVTGGDLYEILAADPYTDDDLNYNDNSSRSTSEQNDKSARPEIGSEDISLEGYTTIYLGFPIWWGEEPRILDTFVEKYSFEGITVIPFCTSGGSGIGRSGPDMEALAGSGTWLEGKRFSGNVSEADLQSWIDGLK
ncbi:MAG: flavodoxin [Oscillospiraceae bacterium]|nr:flavodoxin [Eubacterium sp.]MBR3000944.1 flavodoxin [Oscillospiraceae bacterium]